MGLGMHNSSNQPRGRTLNYNLKGDGSVHTFVEAAGLNVQNFPEYLSGLVARGHDLAGLSNAEWNQILAPMELGGERAKQVHKAISDLRAKAAKEDAERAKINLHNHLMNGGSHPHARPNAEVYEPTLNGSAVIAKHAQSKHQQLLLERRARLEEKEFPMLAVANHLQAQRAA